MLDFISQKLLIKNRKKLIDKLEENSIAIINSNKVYKSNADVELPFYQNSDFLYLTGIDNPDTILLISKTKEGNQEILFIKEQTEKEKIWQGEKINIKIANEKSGINEVLYTKEFEKIFKALLYKTKNIYFNSSELLRNEHNLNNSFSLISNKPLKKIGFNDIKFIKSFKEKYPKFNYLDLSPILKNLRAIKEKQEIEIIKKACEITNQAFRKIFKIIKPKTYEYEIEAEFIYQFKKQGCRGFAYNPIVASGKNSCILHYEENNSQLKDGDLLLLDIGVSYKGYNSDITRTIPVNGKFTQRQKQIYNAVLFVMKEAKKLLKSNVTFKDYNKRINEIMEDQLLKLALINKSDIKTQNPLNPVFRKYFMHGVSHHLGLDVHDPVNYDLPITQGMVLTIEPGIYIKEENIGIRLETDVVIREDGIEDLGKNIPIETEEIESLIQ